MTGQHPADRERLNEALRALARAFLEERLADVKEKMQRRRAIWEHRAPEGVVPPGGKAILQGYEHELRLLQELLHASQQRDLSAVLRERLERARQRAREERRWSRDLLAPSYDVHRELVILRELSRDWWLERHGQPRAA